MWANRTQPDCFPFAAQSDSIPELAETLGNHPTDEMPEAGPERGEARARAENHARGEELPETLKDPLVVCASLGGHDNSSSRFQQKTPAAPLCLSCPSGAQPLHFSPGLIK